MTHNAKQGLHTVRPRLVVVQVGRESPLVGPLRLSFLNLPWYIVTTLFPPQFEKNSHNYDRTARWLGLACEGTSWGVDRRGGPRTGSDLLSDLAVACFLRRGGPRIGWESSEPISSALWALSESAGARRLRYGGRRMGCDCSESISSWVWALSDRPSIPPLAKV